jgi:hypothetical protein
MTSFTPVPSTELRATSPRGEGVFDWRLFTFLQSAEVGFDRELNVQYLPDPWLLESQRPDPARWNCMDVVPHPHPDPLPKGAGENLPA